MRPVRLSTFLTSNRWRQSRRSCLRAIVAIVLAAIWTAGSLSASAQAPPSDRTLASSYIVDTWTTRHGLPQNMVRVLRQTRDGHLWIGTASAGLVRFDGVTFTTFDITNTPELPSNGITALYEDGDGVLWIGTYAGAATHQRGVFAAAGGDTIHGGVTAITADTSGRIWITEESRVVRKDGDGWSEVFRRPDATRINDILIDEAGAAWIGSDRGLFVVTTDGVAMAAFADAPFLSPVRVIRATSAGTIVVGTDRGLALLDRRARRLVPQPSPFGDAPVTGLFEERDGALWIASRTRLARRTRAGVTTVQDLASASGAQVSAILEDRDGQIWLGTEAGDGGLIRLRPRLVSELSQDDGLPCDNIGAVTEDAGGTVWLSPWCYGGGGVVAIRAGRIRPYALAGVVSALLTEPDGHVWAGTFDGRLFVLEDDRFVERAIDGLERPAVIAVLHRDTRGALWAGTSKGLLRESGGQWSRVGETEGLSSRWIRTIVAGAGDTLWIGSDSGVHAYAGGRFTSYEHPDWKDRSPVRAVYPDSDGHVWVGTYGSGLCRLADGRFHCFGTLDGLLDTSVHRVIEDEDGFLWMSGDHGIRRVRRTELEALADGRAEDVSVVMLDESDGLPSAETNGMAQPAGWRSTDGTLLFPTQRGLVRVDRRVIGRRALSALTPGVRDVRVDGELRAVAGELTVTSGTREVEFRWGAPALAHPERVRFRYRLDGYDVDWMDAGPDARARYFDLPAGSYRFHVAARAGGGAWSEAPATVSMTVQPGPREWLVRIGAGLMLLLIATAAWRWRAGRRAVRTRSIAPASTAGALTEETLAEVRKQEEAAGTQFQLRSMKREIDRASGQVRAVLEQIDLAVLVLDGTGIVQHVNEPARRLLVSGEGETLEGRRWDECLLVTASDRSRLKAGIDAPPLSGDRIPTQIAVGAKRYWMIVEVRASAAPGEGCLLGLHDVTEIDTDPRGDEPPGQFGLIGASSAMHVVYKQIRDVARVDATVLIEGETGTGKELVARAIHRGSSRAGKPFIAVNAAGFAEPILASQLFGHRRGAFTGAVADQTGLFEAAAGGTLFLDEIGDVPLGVQASLLRVLQEREITRVGDARPTRLDIRFLAATHRDLAREVDAGRFRQDLLYRIRVTVVQVPPLRQRSEDVPLLVDAFVQEAARLAGLPAPRVSHDAMDALVRCRWPGNVRQLKSAVDQAVIAHSGPILRLEHLPPEVVSGGEAGSSPEERAQLLDALRRANGNRNEAARLLGIGRATLYRKLAAHGIRAGRVPQSQPVRPDETP